VAVAVVEDRLEQPKRAFCTEIVLLGQDPDEVVTGGLDGETVLLCLLGQGVDRSSGADTLQRHAVGGLEQHLPLRLGKLGVGTHAVTTGGGPPYDGSTVVDLGADPGIRLLVDGNNVVGAAVAGWWRDPPAAVRRLLGRLRCYTAVTGDLVELVLDVPQPDLPEGDHDGVVVRYATRRGRDAADDRILELLEGPAADVEVITSDRALGEGARRRGARVTGAGAFLARLDDAGC